MGGNLGGKLAGRSGTRARATRRHAAAKHVNHERLRAGGVGVEAVSGASVTSKAIFTAVTEALAGAQA